MATKTEIAEVLEKAADLYESETVEWCRGDLLVTDASKYNERRSIGSSPMSATKLLSVCAVGALMIAAEVDMVDYYNVAGPYDSDHRARMKLVRTCRQLVVDKMNLGMGLEAWNDSVVKNKATVIEAFKETAKDLRNEPVS